MTLFATLPGIFAFPLVLGLLLFCAGLCFFVQSTTDKRAAQKRASVKFVEVWADWQQGSAALAAIGTMLLLFGLAGWFA